MSCNQQCLSFNTLENIVKSTAALDMSDTFYNGIMRYQVHTQLVSIVVGIFHYI